MATIITLHFHDRLNDFLPCDQRGQALHHELGKSRSVKDLIESLGIPHPEVDSIVIDGMSVDFSCIIDSTVKIDVYPYSVSPDVSPLQHLQPATPVPASFILDVHLGKLAGYLRMLGFDTWYRNDYEDAELAQASSAENRILLTCDRRLLNRNQVALGYFVRSRIPLQQVEEVLGRYDLKGEVRPFTRCISCNGIIESVDKDLIASRLQPKTRQHYDDFYMCTGCRKIYWEGSHLPAMQALITSLSTDESRGTRT